MERDLINLIKKGLLAVSGFWIIVFFYGGKVFKKFRGGAAFGWLLCLAIIAFTVFCFILKEEKPPNSLLLWCINGSFFVLACFFFCVVQTDVFFLTLAVMMLLTVACVKWRKLLSKKLTDSQQRVKTLALQGQALQHTLGELAQELFAVANLVQNKQVKDQGLNLYETVQGMLGLLNGMPEQALKTKDFVRHYLPMTVNLIKQYCELEICAEKSQELVATMREVEQTLPLIQVAFQKEQEMLQNKRAFDLSLDVQVLRTLFIDADGLVWQEQAQDAVSGG